MDLLQSGTYMCVFPANYEFKSVKLFLELQVIKNTLMKSSCIVKVTSRLLLHDKMFVLSLFFTA